MRRRSPALVTAIILPNNRLVRLAVRRRRWLLPPLVRMTLPVPVTRNRLAVALWVLSLYFFTIISPARHCCTAQLCGAANEKFVANQNGKTAAVVTSFFLYPSREPIPSTW